MNNNELYSVIRIKYDNNSATLEELAEQFDMTEDFIFEIVNGFVEYNEDFDEAIYDSRKGKCGTCGTPVDGDGIPDNCTGDCGRDLMGYFSNDYPEHDGEPDELKFD